MTLKEFINSTKRPAKIKFDGVIYERRGNQDTIWIDYRYTAHDGCYEDLSSYCLTPSFLDYEVEEE